MVTEIVKMLQKHMDPEITHFFKTIQGMERHSVGDPEEVQGVRFNPPPRPQFLNIL